MTEKIHEICLRLAVLLEANPELKEISFTCNRRVKGGKQAFIDLALTVSRYAKALVVFEPVDENDMKITIKRG